MSIWDVFVWMLVFYIVVACLIIFITAVFDVLRDAKTSGWAKAGWVLFFFVLPVIGILAYVIVSSRKAV